jgi:hypothetical protein
MLPLLTLTPFHKLHPKTKFTQQEDLNLTDVVRELGTSDWQQVARQMPGRNARQCRDRWLNYLSPDVSNGPWTPAEEQLLIEKYAEFGATWKHIATFFPTRTDINVKSRWQLMQRHRRKEASRNMLPTGMTKHMALSSDPLPFGVTPVRHTRPPPPPTPMQTQTHENSGEDDIWNSLLMNDDAGMGGMLDQWY